MNENPTPPDPSQSQPPEEPSNPQSNNSAQTPSEEPLMGIPMGTPAPASTPGAAPGSAPAAVAMPVPDRPSNTLGLAGFITSLASLITCGFLSPISLILSFIALFKKPRGFAMAGTLISLVGIALAGSIATGGALATIWGMNQIQTMQAHIQNQIAFTTGTAGLDDYYAQQQMLPDDAAGQNVLSQYAVNDAWGNPLRYRKLSSDRFELISDGPDATPNTPDDVTAIYKRNANGDFVQVDGTFDPDWQPFEDMTQQGSETSPAQP